MGSDHRSKPAKQPWPTKAAMQQVYAKGLWGGNGSTFYSGEGSHDTRIVDPYVAVVTEFLSSFETPLSVCDLGCGDFNVGKAFVPLARKYTAVDIVPELITHNQSVCSAPNLQFQCLDIAKDMLPKADCVIVRQVLQHLSNAEIQEILPKLKAYKYFILTEHIPQGEFVPNIDIISGQGTRLKKGSGVDLTAPPFNFKVKKQEELLNVIPENGKGCIKTMIYHLS